MDKGIIIQVVGSISYYLSNREKRYAILLFLLLIISSVLDVFGLASLVPVIMAASSPDKITSNKYLSFLYHTFHFQSEQSFLIFLILGIFMFFLFKNLFITWINYKQVKFTAGIALNIINRQFNKYTNLPYWHFNNTGSSKLINNVLGVPQYFVSGIIRPLFILLSEIAIILVIIVGIFIYQPLLFTILISVLAPSAILTYQFLKKRSERLGRKLNDLRPFSYGILTNTFNGFVELKLANKITTFKDRFVANQKETQALEAKSYLFSQIPLKVIEMVAILGVVTIFLYSILFSETSGSLITILGLFAAAAYRLMPSVNRLITSLVSLKQNSVAITELKQFQEYDLVEHRKEAWSPFNFEHQIRFNNVSFSFPGAAAPAIHGVNITINKGEKVGFIGASGSGKTTLMNLLLRFYTEQEGAIQVDGVSLNESNVNSWYDLIGYVKQDTFLMESSIEDNITLMDPVVDQQRLAYALEQASLTDFIQTLPHGVKALIGEKGSKLSGGQKQRIGIARALYKNVKVLVLDEATSALDTNTEREVSEAINKLSHTDITIFIIAHRITTLRDCDRIYEMKNGKIVAERTYEDVLQEVI